MARSVEELVDRQMRRWELGRRARAQAPPRPCIALSRLPGAGAAELGRRVAEALDYTFFGIEIVDWIARSTGLSRQLVAGVDERIRGAIDRAVSDSFRSQRFTESDYLRHVVRVVTALGEQGSAVILGRGSPFILPAERALRALVVAPPELRAENLAKQGALPAERARAALEEEDAKRLEFLRHHFGRDPDDSIHYDLVLNLGTLAQDAAARLLIEALEARFPRGAAARPRPRPA
jgi:cytidylate kinase